MSVYLKFYTRVVSFERTNLLVFIVVFSSLLCVSSADSDESSAYELVYVRIPHEAKPVSRSAADIYLPSDRYVDGCQIVRTNVSDPTNPGEVLTPEFVAACDPAISFDGQSMLFAGKKSANDRWQIWRMDLNGGVKTQITKSRFNCYSPLYVGALFHLNDQQPTDQFVYCSDEPGWINEIGFGISTSLFVSDFEWNTPTRITYNLSSDYDPEVLPNGRVVYSSWRYHDKAIVSQGKSGLLAVNIDGADFLPYAGYPQTDRFWDAARYAMDGRVYFIESQWTYWLGGGDLVCVSQRRPLHSYQVVARQSEGLYHSPCSLPDGRLLVSYRSTLDDACYQIVSISPETGVRGIPLVSREGWHCVDAQVVSPRPKVKGRSTVVNLQKNTGIVYCLNVYNSQSSALNQRSPGEIRRVRVLEGVPVHSIQQRIRVDGFSFAGLGANQYTGTRYAARRILGIAPVDHDGSFHIEVPAHTPFTFQLLDKNGIAVETQHTWTWVHPRESRGCIGCHEDRELSPQNKLVTAITKPAVPLTLPPERRRTVDFVHEISPIVENKCSGIQCHSPGGVQPELDVRSLVELRGDSALFSSAYVNLLNRRDSGLDRPYVIPGQAGNSPLILRMLGEIGSDRPNACPIGNGPSDRKLTNLEKTLWLEWVDLGASWNIRDLVTSTQAASSPVTNSPASTADPTEH